MNIFDVILGKNTPPGSTNDLTEMVKLVQGINQTISIVVQLIIESNKNGGSPYKVSRAIRSAMGRLSEDTQNTIRGMKATSAKDMSILIESLKGADYLMPQIKQEIASLFAGIRILNITGDMDEIPDHIRSLIEKDMNSRNQSTKEKTSDSSENEEPDNPEERLRNKLELE